VVNRFCHLVLTLRSYVYQHTLVCTPYTPGFGLDLQEAIDAPRFQPGGGVVVLERPIPQEILKALQQRGHVVGRTELSLGGAQAIYVDAKNGVLSAGSDPRKDGGALGY